MTTRDYPSVEVVERVFEGRYHFYVFIDLVAAHSDVDEFEKPRRRTAKHKALGELASLGIIAEKPPHPIDWDRFTRLMLQLESGIIESLRWEDWTPSDSVDDDERDEITATRLSDWIDRAIGTRGFVSLVKHYFEHMASMPLSEDRHLDVFNLQAAVVGFREALQRYIPSDVDPTLDTGLIRLLSDWSQRSGEILGPSDFHFREAMARAGISKGVLE